jgi:ADP-ribose diphosphatase
MAFQRIEEEEVWSGKTFTVRVERFRHDDGEEVEREVARHPRVVAIVAHDGQRLHLVRHPREAVGEQALLELPAGKVDQEGETPLDTAKRELREEIGKGAREWRLLTRFYTSPGFTDEEVHLYLATGLEDAPGELDESERLEIVTEPLDRIDELVEDCRDAKTLVGLLWLRSHLRDTE